MDVQSSIHGYNGCQGDNCPFSSLDEDQVEQYLQAKTRCQNYSQYGSIRWRIDERLFTKRYTDVIFYYFDVNQHEIIGSSTRLTVVNPSAVSGFRNLIVFVFNVNSLLWMVLYWMM